jgi:ribosome biogenesis GTPase
VAAALAEGRLEQARFDSYGKLQRELRFLELKKDARARSEEQRKWKVVTKDMRRNYKARSDRG